MQESVNDERLPARGQRHAEANVAALIAHWRERGEPVVHVHADGPGPDEPAPAVLAQAAPRDDEVVIDHRGANTFIGTDLMQVLEDTGQHEIVVVGAVVQGAVESTVRMAHAMGFMCFVPEDAVIAREVASRDGRRWSAEEAHAMTLAVIDGAFGQVVTSGALTQKGGH